MKRAIIVLALLSGVAVSGGLVIAAALDGNTTGALGWGAACAMFIGLTADMARPS